MAQTRTQNSNSTNTIQTWTGMHPLEIQETKMASWTAGLKSNVNAVDPPPMQNWQTDNGWPVRLTQTTLDNYISATHPTSQTNTTERQNPPQQNVSWEDQVTNGQNTTPPTNARQLTMNREPTPLEYVWTPRKRTNPVNATNMAAERQQIPTKPTQPTTKPKTKCIQHMCNTRTTYRFPR